MITLLLLARKVLSNVFTCSFGSVRLCALWLRPLSPCLQAGLASCCLVCSLECCVTRMLAGYLGDDVFVIIVYCLSGATILITRVVNHGRFPFSQNLRFYIPENFRFEWKGLFPPRNRASFWVVNLTSHWLIAERRNKTKWMTMLQFL